MALVKGVNCGFVDSAPSGDPGVDRVRMDTRCKALRDGIGAGVYRVTEIGWWCIDATPEANYEVGIYEHDSGNDRPGALVAKNAVNAKGVTSGWKRSTGLSISVSGSTIYWVAVQLDEVAVETAVKIIDSVGEKYDVKYGATEIVDPWGSSGATYEGLVAFYAVVESLAAIEDGRCGCLLKMSPALRAGPGLYV